MAYKFNRNCWVGSLEETQFCRAPARDARPGDERGASDAVEHRSRHAVPATIEEMVRSADGLYARWRRDLKGDAAILDRVRRLEENVEESRRGMRDSGIVAGCTRCDANSPEGSCCSRGLEKKYGPILLLMNRMLGLALPERRMRADSCYFLGWEGCVLKARHMLCIDYLCPELAESLGPQALIEIQTLSGREIESVFMLGEAIKRKIRALSV